jgi:predicted secreted hydrolase
MEITTPLPQQEMVTTSRQAPNYWEGAIRITGVRSRSPIAGVGYLEMTGYDRPVRLGP